MSPTQIGLARHALGLPNKSKQSYRNRFVTGPGTPDYVEWMAMFECGYAGRREGKTLPFGGDDLFWLTLLGAGLALNDGETLDREDFPSPSTDESDVPAAAL